MWCSTNGAKQPKQNVEVRWTFCPRTVRQKWQQEVGIQKETSYLEHHFQLGMN